MTALRLSDASVAYNMQRVAARIVLRRVLLVSPTREAYDMYISFSAIQRSGCPSCVNLPHWLFRGKMSNVRNSVPVRRCGWDGAWRRDQPLLEKLSLNHGGLEAALYGELAGQCKGLDGFSAGLWFEPECYRW